MKLDLKDRLIISNQLKILERLYPDEAEYYSQHRTAVERGYSLHYSWLVEHFHDEMTDAECSEVLNVLDMYRAIAFSYDKLTDKSGIDEYFLEFKGFDGNNESKQFSYVQYFILGLGRFNELRYGAKYPDFNSHMPTLEKYRKMLEEWDQLGKPIELNKKTLIQLLGA